MKIMLEYIEGEVVAKDSITGTLVNEDGLPALFKPYYQRMKKAFEREMSVMEIRMANLGGHADIRVDSKLDIKLELKDITK